MTHTAHQARRRLAVVLGAVLATFAVLVAGAGPAAAHGASGSATGAAASNYQQRIDGFDPGVEGVELTIDPVTQQLVLTNTGTAEVTLMGYSGEPYLRVGPTGVWENTRSPSVYLNTSVDGTAAVPETADATAEPDWRQRSTGTSVRWHDHRTHWMGGTPPIAQLLPTQTHEIAGWTVPLDIDGTRVDATGTTLWVPGPDSTGWLLLAVVLGLVVGALGIGRSARRHVALACAAIVLAAASVTIVLGDWWASPESSSHRLTDLVPALLGGAFLVAGAVSLRRNPKEGLVLVGIGAVTLGVLHGALRRSYLSASQLPTNLPVTLARGTVAVALGVGIGIGIAVVLELVLGRIRSRPAA